MTDAANHPTPRERAEQHFADYATKLSNQKGPLKLRDEAAAAARVLITEDPDAWDEFVDAVTGEVIATRLRSWLARHRHSAIYGEKMSVFRTLRDDTIAAIESGDNPPSPFNARYSLPGSNGWLRLGEMTRVDLLAVAHHRSGLARSNAIEAIFLRALADRLPDDTATVEDALSELDVVNLHNKAEHSNLGELPTPPPDTEKDPDHDQPE